MLTPSGMIALAYLERKNNMDTFDINYFKQFDIDKFAPPYISMLIPSLGRKAYLVKCVDSIIKNADTFVEIVISDDGSPLPMQVEILSELRDRCSTFIMNPGYNTGLARAWNRARSVATSKYLMGIPDDNFFTSPFLKRVMWALDKPYVGSVTISYNIGEQAHALVLPDGSRMVMTRGIGNPNVFGIRAEVWDEVGGWDTNIQSTASDCSFFGHVFAKGYFSVYIDGSYTNEMWPVSEDKKLNVSGSNKEYIEAASFAHGDTNIPNLFHGDKPFKAETHFRLCESRREKVWHGVNDLVRDNRLAPSWTNANFCCQEVAKLYPNNSLIDWEFAKEYGHDKWKDMVMKDFNITNG